MAEVPEVVYVNFDDWEAWYIDGLCVGQTHRVQSQDIMNCLAKGGTITFRDTYWEESPGLEDYLENNDRFPETLDELEEATGERYRP